MVAGEIQAADGRNVISGTMKQATTVTETLHARRMLGEVRRKMVVEGGIQ